MVAFAVEWLTKLFGSEIAAAIRKSSATRWNAAPFALGAMSSPRRAGSRRGKSLAEPIGCMFLAGEATHETLWGTVDGAWESGERAAEAALRQDRRAKRYRTRGGRKPAPGAPIRETSRNAGALWERPTLTTRSRPKALISWSSGKDSAFALQ